MIKVCFVSRSGSDPPAEGSDESEENTGTGMMSFRYQVSADFLGSFNRIVNK